VEKPEILKDTRTVGIEIYRQKKMAEQPISKSLSPQIHNPLINNVK